jgi:hypothetical protein
MGNACSVLGVNKNCIQNFDEETSMKEAYYMRDLNLSGTIGS